MNEHESLQSLCRSLLSKVRRWVEPRGFKKTIDRLIKENAQGKCVATQDEVDMLSRAVNEERIARNQIPHLLGISYRRCVETDVFDNIRKLDNQGTYSLNDTIVLKETQYKEK